MLGPVIEPPAVPRWPGEVAMELPALAILERAERAARERRLAAGLEAERRAAAAEAEAARIERTAVEDADRVAAETRRAVMDAAEAEVKDLERGIGAPADPSPEALETARRLVVAALLGEDPAAER
jgi:hypothetical protein